MFHRYIAEREVVDQELGDYLESEGLGRRVLDEEEIEAAFKEMKVNRVGGEDDLQFFERCLVHAWSVICKLRTTDLTADPNKLLKKFEVEDKRKGILTIQEIIQVFKSYFKNKIETLDDAIIILAFSLQILDINCFWKDIRRFMRDSKSEGLKTLLMVAGL